MSSLGAFDSLLALLLVASASGTAKADESSPALTHVTELPAAA